MGYSTSTKEAAKAMYAISALIRNNVNGQEAFALENGNAMLQVVKILSWEYKHITGSAVTKFPTFAAHLGKQQC